MAIPKPRKEGQTGGWMGHKHNEAASRARGGSPRAKKPAKPPKPPKGRPPKKSGSGCLVWIAAPIIILAIAGGSWVSNLI